MTTAIKPTTESAIQTWTLDAAHTHVEFAVKHLMISTVKGRFGGVTGSLTGDIAQPKGFQLEVEIDAGTIDTRQDQRDAHLRSPDFFDVQKFPVIRFAGRKVEGDTGENFTLIGDLTIRDVTREIRLAVANEGALRDPWGNSRVGFSASGKIDRREFGLTWNQVLEAGGIAVGDEIRISVDAEFTASN